MYGFSEHRFLDQEAFGDSFELISRSKTSHRVRANQFGRGEAEPLYVHLRVRGFSRYDSFVAAYGENWFGHPDAIELAARTLEGQGYQKEFQRILKRYEQQELFALWDGQAALSKAKTSVSVKALSEEMARLDEQASERSREMAEGIRRAQVRDSERAEAEAEALRNFGEADKRFIRVS